jgi:GMP synthase-like glutamine amidotransferase
LLASGDECGIQAMKHGRRIIYGTQFHPENYDDRHLDGKIILQNFFRIAGIPPRSSSKD